MSVFTDEELRELRNEVPINRVIAELGIPTKVRDGYLRFLCPLCHEFHTATNADTNLARCFRCERSFNPIDITMAAAPCTFKSAASGLTRLLARIRGSPSHYRA